MYFYITVEKVSSIKDLGIILDEKLTFKCHLNYILGKAKSTLAWFKRYSYEFDDPWVIKRLYETFVVPIIEYASVIWSPKYMNDTIRIESVQKQFLIFALRKLGWNDGFRLPSYKNRLLFFHMNTLEERRFINQIIFIISLIYGKISSSELLNMLNFRIPNSITRNNNLLNTYIAKYDHPFENMKKKFNEYANLFDFNQSIHLIKTNLKNHFKQILDK